MSSDSTFSLDSLSHQIITHENKFRLCEIKNFESIEEPSLVSPDEDECKLKKYNSSDEQSVCEPVKKLSLWRTILKESNEKKATVCKWKHEYMKSESDQEIDHNSPIKYLNEKIFPILLPTMEQMLIEACKWNALENQRCLFNGLDYLAHLMWNKNPQHPERNENWLQLFDIPPFNSWLKEHPRLIFPKSWLWTKEQAALHIQRYVRGWIVRKRDDVRELREFWKAIAIESNAKDIYSTNKNLTDISAEIRELSICDQYKMLTKLYTADKK